MLKQSSPVTMPVIDLAHATRGNYQPTRGFLTLLAWFCIEALVIDNRLIPLSMVRTTLLKLFGAKIGKRCRLRQAIRVKFPWNLEIGDDTWIGEDVWFHNQAPLKIGSHVCISQGTFVTCGSHDVDTTMDLRVAPVAIEDGAWVTSRCVVLRGVTIGRNTVVTPQSVVHRSLAPDSIYGGNPCRFVRKRFAR